SPAVTISTRPPRHSFRFRGRNFLALVLRPALPISQWLSELDDWLARSPGFFTGKPLIPDLACAPMERAAITGRICDPGNRAVRIMGIEGADPSALDAALPPLLTGGRTLGAVEVAEAIAPAPAAAGEAPKPDQTKPEPATPDKAGSASAVTPLPGQSGK